MYETYFNTKNEIIDTYNTSKFDSQGAQGIFNVNNLYI